MTPLVGVFLCNFLNIWSIFETMLDIYTSLKKMWVNTSISSVGSMKGYPMRKFLTLIAIYLFIISNSIMSNSIPVPFEPTYKPSITIPFIAKQIIIDGELNEDFWKEAAVAYNFVETNPGDQIKPLVESKALIAYDEKNLYVSLIAYDDPSTIRASLSDRDNIFKDDYFGIMLDTYGDQSWGYELFVNPYGIQGDLRMNSNGEEEMSFDIVWESMGKITDSGYQVEIAIPFASLRFPDKEVQNWRVNFWRDHQREVRRRYSWAAMNRDDPCFLCKWGYLEGIKGIKPGNNLELLPNIISSQSGSRADTNDPSSRFENENPKAELSFNGRYGLSSTSSLELALNPDFSQVESDAAQINVNNTFGLFFPETRPFFQEGGQLLGTYINAIYTRSINDPQVAVKFTGQVGKTELYYIFALDENSTILVPFKQQALYSQADKSVVNIFRARQSLSNDSYFGVLFTDRRLDDFGENDMHKGGSNSVFGFDGAFRVWNNYRFQIQSLFSYTEEILDARPYDTTISDGDTTIDQTSLINLDNQEFFDRGRKTVALDGEKFWGTANFIGIERNARTWNFDFAYTSGSPTFRAENGFYTQNNYHTVDFWTGLFFRPNYKWLVQWEPSIRVLRSWNYHDKIKPFKYNESSFDEGLWLSIYLQTNGQTDITLTYLASQERFFGQNITGISLGTLNVNSIFSEILSGGFRYNFGKAIWRDRSNPDLGFQKGFSIWANIKPSERLLIQPEYNFYKMDRLDSYMADPAHAGEEKEIVNATVFRTRVNVQFNRELNLRLIVQYINEKTQDYSYRNISIEPLLTYKVNPFTKFYIGMNSGYDYVNPNEDNSLINSRYSLNNRQFFAKFQYLFRI